MKYLKQSLCRHVVAIVMFACMGAGPLHAEADGPDHFRVTGVASNDTLNIRAGASSSSRKLGEIPPDGNGIRNLGCKGGLSFAQWQSASPAQRKAAQNSRWCRVSYNGVTGWVAARFLAEGSAPSSAAGGAPPNVSPPIKRSLSQDETLRRIAVPANGSISIKGTIEGYKHEVYAISIGVGETLTVRFDTRSTSAYFNVIDASDASGAAIHRGEVDGKSALVKAARPMTYLIQPYLVRAVARRGARAGYTFSIARQSGQSAAQPQAFGGQPSSSGQASASPSFDCSKADSSATNLICRDAMLAAVDRETTRLFKLALAGRYMNADRRKELVTVERGWIKGRDDCWKAKDLRRCIFENYLQRIHQLRQGYANARTQDANGISSGPLVLVCKGLDALVGATFVQSEPPSVYLEWRANNHALALQPSGSGARYVASYDGGEVTLWTKGKSALLKPAKQKELSCSIEQPG